MSVPVAAGTIPADTAAADTADAATDIDAVSAAAATTDGDNAAILVDWQQTVGTGTETTSDNINLLADDAAAVAAGTSFRKSSKIKIKQIITKHYKYALPLLSIVIGPVWLLGGFSGLGAGSPIGVNVC